MRGAILFAAVCSMGLTARADFSYTTTSKPTGGTMAAMAGGAGQTSKMYFKGQRMKTDTGDAATIIDFGAGTLTNVNHRTKTVSVRKLSELGAAAPSNASVKIDVKETGQQKSVSGYNAKELLITMDMDMPQMGKMQMEVDLWLSSDVPGAGELREFYRKNMELMPWASMAGPNPQMQQAISQIQRKVAEMNGVQVESVMKMKPAGGAGAPTMPQMTAAQQAQMQAAMDRMKQIQQQGGPGADALAQAMGRMGSMGRGPAPGASNSMMEITTEASGFSTASIPDSVFAIPADYQRTEGK